MSYVINKYDLNYPNPLLSKLSWEIGIYSIEDDCWCQW